MSKSINANKLPDFIFRYSTERNIDHLTSNDSVNAGSSRELNIQRILSIALPFLALNSTTARISSIGVGFYQCYTLWNTPSSQMTMGYKWANGALLVSSTALGYFFPLHQLALSSGVFFGTHLYRLYANDNRSMTLLQIAQQTLHLSSLYYNTPALIVASLLSQAANELAHAYNEKKTPERLASLLLAGIRIHKASTYLPQNFFKRSPPLKVIESPTKLDQTSSIQSEPTTSIDAPILPVEEPMGPLEIVPASSETTPSFSQPEDLPVSAAPAVVEIPPPPLKKITQIEQPIATDETTKAAQEIIPASSETTPSFSQPEDLPVSAAPAVVEIPPPPLKKITQADWAAFVAKFPDHFKNLYSGDSYNSNKEVQLDVKAALQREGFNAELEGLQVKHTFTNCCFQNLNFKNCVFKSSTFANCTFDQTVLQGCSFKKTEWISSNLQNFRLIDCNFYKSRFGNSFMTHLPGQCLFSSLKFIDCNFDKTQFNSVVIDQIKASGLSSFLKAAFYDCKIKGATFKNCPLNNSTLIRSEMENTSLYGLDLTGANWIESKLSQIKIEQGKLSGSSFLLTSATDSQLIDCDLKDALLLDAKSGFEIQGGTPHVVTKPIVALGWNFKEGGPMTRLISKALQDNGALVLKYVESDYNYLSCETQLKEDSLKALKNITPSELSIGQQLLLSAAPDSEIDFLKRRATAILKHAHGLVIPGGGDIEERFYNPSAKVKVSYRSLIEIALLGEAESRNVPTMGICRGAQMINVFFGGTLHDVNEEDGIHKLEWTDSPHKENLQRVLTKDYRGKSMHEQAVKQVGKDLTVVLKRGKVPKMLISNDGNFIASQIHPEAYIDRTKDLTEILSDLEVFKGKTVAEIHAANTSETRTKIQKIFEEATSKIEEEPLKTYFNDIGNVASYLIKHLSKETTFITTNKNLYQYFLEKVLRFRSSSFNP
jgi:gamma-glutamyl-gamma-aminobutyrate hydrolase PuuD/uncharacterized protein YjbI with pentapeptide repeats